MAEIKPIRAWRYNQRFQDIINKLTSPLFDVVTDKQRNNLYKNSLSSIHLSVPQGANPIGQADSTLNQWKRDDTIVQDKLPSIYVYYQYFNLPGTLKRYCRKGFVCHIRIHDWGDQIIMRHEDTIPSSVNNRNHLLEKTRFHASPTHGLYTDPSFHLEGIMDDAITNPIYNTKDYQGAQDVLAVIHDAEIITTFIRHLKNKTIILADGHHRYEASLQLLQQMQKTNNQHT